MADSPLGAETTGVGIETGVGIVVGTAEAAGGGLGAGDSDLGLGGRGVSSGRRVSVGRPGMPG